MAGGEGKKSDLPVRTASAVVMLAVAGTALWLGGWVWTVFVFLVGLGVLREWILLSNAFAGSAVARLVWTVAGAAYCGLATTVLIVLRDTGPEAVVAVLFAVIATDIGAYFAGRTFGGPKIAPSISPSKTWSGLGGGIVGAALAYAAVMPWFYHDYDPGAVVEIASKSLLVGALVAIIAQAGDFFESWMKRRAGVKDSGKLIPGHGGLFDRVDGLLAVCFVLGIAMLATRGVG